METNAGTAKAPTMRARLRAELTAEIKDAARRHMAEEGSAAVSLRAIARELGMVSSAIYRYFPSRDDLLTALIIDAYEAVAEVAEAAQVATSPKGIAARWLAIAGAIRAWAAEHPAEYGLIYGSPVPGYQAPADTIAPALRVSLVFIGIVVAGVHSGEIVPGAPVSMPRTVHADLAGMRELVAPDVSDEVMSRALLVWTQLFGTITFELFGHFQNVIHDYDGFFEVQMHRSATFLINGT